MSKCQNFNVGDKVEVVDPSHRMILNGLTTGAVTTIEDIIIDPFFGDTRFVVIKRMIFNPLRFNRLSDRVYTINKNYTI